MDSSMPVRMIATDMDGTLLNRKGQIPEENIRAIRAAQEKGIVVAIATGRFVENAYVVIQDAGIVCPIIGSNGAKITNEKLELISEHFMDPKAAMQVFDVLDELGSDYFVFGPGFVCTARQEVAHHSELSYGPRITDLGFTYCRGREAAFACVQQAVHKFFVCDNVPLPMVRERLLNISGIELTQSGVRNIEVMPTCIDKAMGVIDMAKYLNIPLSQVMTLGDQENDIPMRKGAGDGVDMGNASEETKAVARFITDTNDECGFARAIEKYAL